MKEQIKITDEELNQIKNLQSKFQENIFSFGKLYLEKIRIESEIKEISNKEQELQKSLGELQKIETEFIDSISKKYGNGNLDISKGIFLPE